MWCLALLASFQEQSSAFVFPGTPTFRAQAANLRKPIKSGTLAAGSGGRLQVPREFHESTGKGGAAWQTATLCSSGLLIDCTTPGADKEAYTRRNSVELNNMCLKPKMSFDKQESSQEQGDRNERMGGHSFVGMPSPLACTARTHVEKCKCKGQGNGEVTRLGALVPVKRS